MFWFVLIASQVSPATLEPVQVEQSRSVVATRSQILLHAQPRSFELTPQEMQLAIERRQSLEDARDTNVDARRQAREVADELASMTAEQVDAGLLVTFDEDAFLNDSESLSATATRRLEAVTSFLRRHSSATVRLVQSRGSPSADTRSVIERRTTLLARFLRQANVATSRTHPQPVGVSPTDSDAAVHMLIEDPLPRR